MTDFMRWLYTHYIKPEIENSDLTGYEMPFAVVDTNLDAEPGTKRFSSVR